MIEIKAFYQYIIFLDAKKFEANGENFKRCIDAFSQYGMFPTVYDEILPGPLVNKRISITTPVRDWVINIGSERIDIFKNFQGAKMGKEEDFVNQCNGFAKHMIDILEAPINRASLCVRMLTQPLDNSEMDSLYRQLFKTAISKNKVLPFEWGLRYANSATITKDAIPLNLVVAISKVNLDPAHPEAPMLNNRIEILLDFNSRTSTTFQWNYDEVKDVFKELVREYTEEITRITNFFKI